MVMVDKVLLASKAQNCLDVFIFNLKSLVDAQPSMSQLVPCPGTLPESVSSVVNAFIPQAVLSIKENILTFIAGYMYKQTLTGILNVDDPAPSFIAKKQYADLNF